MSKVTSALNHAEWDRQQLASTTNGRHEAVDASVATAPESWEQAMELVKRRLAGYEQQVADREAAQRRLTAQLAALEQLLAQIEQERNTVHQRLEDTVKAASAIEKEKAVWLRQMEALRECQTLSHALRMAEQEQLANTLLITQVTESQQRRAKELVQYQQRGDALHTHLEQLRFRLAQTLAFTGTTDAT